MFRDLIMLIKYLHNSGGLFATTHIYVVHNKCLVLFVTHQSSDWQFCFFSFLLILFTQLRLRCWCFFFSCVIMFNSFNMPSMYAVCAFLRVPVLLFLSISHPTRTRPHLCYRS